MFGLKKIKVEIINLQCELHKLKVDLLDEQEQKKQEEFLLSQIASVEKNTESQLISQNKVLSDFGSMIRKLSERIEKIEQKKKPGRKPKADAVRKS